MGQGRRDSGEPRAPGRRGRVRSLGTVVAALGALGVFASVLVLGPRGLGGEPAAQTPGARAALGRVSGERCATALGEKLGLSLVRLCSPAASGADAPVWLSDPIPCGMGRHDTVPCPMATPLVQLRSSGPMPGPSLLPRPTALVDGFTAHRLCGMRFGGRLPTRDERTRAAARLGIATLVVRRASGNAPEAIAELPEWVSERPCNNPSLPDARCGVTVYPSGPPPALDTTHACSARPRAFGGGDAFDLRCGEVAFRTQAATHHALAAVRCLVPRHAVGSFADASVGLAAR